MKMSLVAAPTDLRMPISRTRSGDAGQHDVHDADAPDQEADAGDEAAADSGVVDESVDLLSPILLGAEGEILDGFVGAHQHVADLLEGLGQSSTLTSFNSRLDSRGSATT